MTDKFRALFAELVELSAPVDSIPQLAERLQKLSELADRARALLAEPEVAWEPMPLPGDAEGLAEVFWAEPVAEGPTDEELWELYQGPGTFSPVEFARAVLARWGRPTPQPVAEGLTDEELVEWLRENAEDERQISNGDNPASLNLDRAATLLQQQAAPVPVAWEVAELIAQLQSRVCGPAALDFAATLIEQQHAELARLGIVEWLNKRVQKDWYFRAAAPAPEPGEVEGIAEWLNKRGQMADLGTRDWYFRAATLLQQQATPVPGASNTYFEFVVFDADDCTQAEGIAPTYAQALSEGQHYLAQYQQDGPHTLELRRVEVLNPDALPLPAPEGGEVS